MNIRRLSANDECMQTEIRKLQGIENQNSYLDPKDQTQSNKFGWPLAEVKIKTIDKTIDLNFILKYFTFKLN